MPQYEYYPTRHFTTRLNKIEQHDPVGFQRIHVVIERLLQYPEDADGRMIGIHRGKYKKYVGRNDYRLIYCYCEMCRNKNDQLFTRCEKCERIKDNSVVFFEVYHKNEAKKLKDSDF